MFKTRISDCDAQCIENPFTELIVAFIIRFSTLVTLYITDVGRRRPHLHLHPPHLPLPPHPPFTPHSPHVDKID